MSDFGEDEYPNMICVEAGIVITPITLNPNNTYEGTIVLQVNIIKQLLYVIDLSSKNVSLSV